MKYVPLLVQEREVKIPAPVLGVAARAAAAPPLPPFLPVVLHGKFDCDLSCSAPKVLSDTSYYLTCSHIIQSPALQVSTTLLATGSENLSIPTPLLSASIQTGKNKVMLHKEPNLASIKPLLNLAVYET